ncbi:MAG: DUF1501 domain-containing protein [Planctomycetota bacterium]
MNSSKTGRSMIEYQRSRRRFLAESSASAAALGLGATVPQCFLNAAEAASENEERVLVVVQLTGGNDGLNTVVPHGDSAYYAARPKLAIPKSDVLSIDDQFGLHPNMRGMRDLLDDGMLSVIHAVGYENPNRSHFESMDIWHSCVHKTETRQFGWLGSYLEADSMIGNPSTAGGDVPAIHLGIEQQPFALAARSVRVPTVKKLEEFELRGNDTKALRELLLTDRRNESIPSEDNELLGFLRSSTRNAVSASRRVSEATSSYKADVKYPDSRLGEELKVVAQLINAGMSTRIYYVQLNGFDTHAQQPDAHALLLRQWSESVSAFLRDMEAKGNHERVCVMTFSEFGRRVAENASSGTDHGAAGPVLLCGGAVRSGLIGDAASLTDLQQGDLKHPIDFRSVYAGILKDWLRTDPETVLGKPYPGLDLFV